MGLNYDYTACVNHEELKTDAEWPITNALIWATVAVDLGEITRDNVDEWMVRLAAVSSVYGPPMQSADGSLEFTREMVERRIGLKCNVVSTTRAAFTRRMGKAVMEQAARTTRA